MMVKIIMSRMLEMNVLWRNVRRMRFKFGIMSKFMGIYECMGRKGGLMFYKVFRMVENEVICIYFI